MLVPGPDFVEAPDSTPAVLFVQQLKAHHAHVSPAAGDNIGMVGDYMLGQEGWETVGEMRGGITLTALTHATEFAQVGSGIGKQFLKCAAAPPDPTAQRIQ